MARTKTARATTALDLFLRLWERETMTPGLARQVLRITFSDEEESRIHHLMEKNRDGELTVDEEQELETYVQVWALLSTLHSRARQLLKRRSSERAKRG
jgi:hypothetical protein